MITKVIHPSYYSNWEIGLAPSLLSIARKPLSVPFSKRQHSKTFLTLYFFPPIALQIPPT